MASQGDQEMGTGRPEEVEEALEALEEALEGARRAEDHLKRRPFRSQWKGGRSIGLDYNIPSPGAPPARRLLELPMTRTGVWRCGTKHVCAACCYGPCRADPGRQANECQCHKGKQCRVWDQQAPCLTPYEQAPPSRRALSHATGREEQEEQDLQRQVTWRHGGQEVWRSEGLEVRRSGGLVRRSGPRRPSPRRNTGAPSSAAPNAPDRCLDRWKQPHKRRGGARRARPTSASNPDQWWRATSTPKCATWPKQSQKSRGPATAKQGGNVRSRRPTARHERYGK